MEKGTLYLVSVPIGNKLDITLNAIEVLKTVDIVAAEDTRIFKVLCSNISINYLKLISYHKDNETRSSLRILSILNQGKSVALVSDAGTPRVSDPGHKIVNLCHNESIPIVVVPGPSSVTAALSLCPFLIERYFFIGFPPSQSKKREELFESISQIQGLIVAFEAPHRLVKHLLSAKKKFNRKVFIVRELTKKFEEKFLGSIDELILHFEDKAPRGEFVLIYSNPEVDVLSLSELEQIVLKSDKATKSLAKELKKRTDLSTSKLYKLISDIRAKDV